MKALKVSLIQSPLHWQDVDANLAMFEEKIWALKESTDIIILPEMFNTGFSMNSKDMAEPMNSKTCRWMKQMAEQTKAAITGSLIIKENGEYFNRLIWMQPDGLFKTYDKRHLFRMADEHENFSYGKERLIVEYKNWKIAPFICYDLRFPVWSRNIDLKYDLAVYVANWPAPRVNAWTTLLQARAIENLSYTLGVNRLGSDGNNFEFMGQSAVYSFKGIEMASLKDKDSFITVELDPDTLNEFRSKFPTQLDADKFEIL